ncbi:MAG: abortive infection family protein [Deltaproteobacteria bacterium]|nr:abortive infection family protein [Deltaproteobacteria bacterium]
MSGGYVLDFTDRTFSEFVSDAVQRDIDDPAYRYASGSKANRLRGFWTQESDTVVARLLDELITYASELPNNTQGRTDEILECRRIADSLRLRGNHVEIEALSTDQVGHEFDVLVAEVRHSLEQNQPDVGLDRLHTLTIKYLRSLCAKRGIETSRDQPLHSILGEYVKKLKSDGKLESDMTVKILRGANPIFESFGQVRNHNSLAHDNRLLNRDESLLIIGYMVCIIRFVRSIDP